ncbi:hypothetical protein SAMN05444392_12421 [Seinonella peptonophila]|uniref:Uncharacterized protein n=1 Tax=Seinonella peptonophila TaxID=112248 RepID=A0A1M5BIN8_9BACL|nr:hypothetical protein [Seinonella peptonophila]SHF42286.1 hypothetical protein SAMN05444392_12421 [Seinonella peptonophila]
MPLDFEVIAPNLTTEEFYFLSDKKTLVIAQDGMGGIFAIWERE